MNRKAEEEIERTLQKLLDEGIEQEQVEKMEQQIRARLAPRYEIRQTAVLDPIVEETKQIRQHVEEIDERYDKYMEQAEKYKQNQKEEMERSEGVV